MIKYFNHSIALLLGAGVLGAQEIPVDPSPGNGPYSIAAGNPTNEWDAPVPGFVGPDGIGKANINDGFGFIANPNNYVNPLFFGWADTVVEYSLRDDPNSQDLYDSMSLDFIDPNNVLGPVTGDIFDVTSLGDLTAPEILAWQADPLNNMGPGTITLAFDAPIRDMSGADFTVFENGFPSNYSTANGSVLGQLTAELAYVEVSEDGINFVRFPSVSRTPSQVGGFGTIDSSMVYNLAGKHANAYGFSWGTPFDLADVGLSSITHIRLVDIPGDGSFFDDATQNIDPASGLNYSGQNPIFDAWYTFGSAGADIEAIGVVSQFMSYSEWPQLLALPLADRDPTADPDKDGLSNLMEYAFAMLPWKFEAGVSPYELVLFEREGGTRAEFSFRRDERLQDLIYQVWVSEDMDQWELMATSVGGQPLTLESGMSAEISDISASEIASVGVIRRVTVRDAPNPVTAGKRFFQLRVLLVEP